MKLENKKNEVLIPEISEKQKVLNFIDENESAIIKCILKRHTPNTIASKLNVPREFASKVLAEYFKSRGLISNTTNKRIRERFAVMAALELDEAKKEVYRIMKTSEHDNIRLKAASGLGKLISEELNLLLELGVLTITPPKEKEGVDITKSLEKLKKSLESSIEEEFNPEDEF